MLRYLLFLAAGAALGLVANGRVSWRPQRLLLPGSVLVLLFFMGVGIGRDPELGSKLGRFGWNALAISSLSVAFSVGAVFLLVKAFRRRP